jgi:hypothetical protein
MIIFFESCIGEFLKDIGIALFVEVGGNTAWHCGVHKTPLDYSP